ncbi:NEW3 domain-containing protein [Streptomyces sp. NPDC060031]|uniref:COG1470 family protein n=1 Tax=Streptomyces sp. NPDC060031 TaxID=3347043 RepID=UPI0036837B20
MYVSVYGPGITAEHPRIVRADPADPAAPGTPSDATVTIAAHDGAHGGPVALEVRAPHGWRASWTRRRADLPPGGHLRFPLTVEPAAGAGPGEHLVRILAATPAGEFEDALTVTVPGGRLPAGLWVQAPDAAVTVAPGARVRVRARIGSTGIRSPLTGTAYLASPYGTWHLAGPAARPVHVEPDRPAEPEFEIRPPLTAPPGDHWMVVKAVCQGRIAYGPAIAVRITGG